MTTLSERLSEALKSSGKTQRDLAQCIKVTEGAVSQWMSGGVKTMKAYSAIRAAACLGVSALWLIEGKGEMLSGYATKEINELVSEARRLSPEQAASITTAMDESDVAKEAGKRLRTARILKGLSRADVCREIGWEGVRPETRISNYENGYRMVGVLEAMALAKLYDVRPGYLLGIEGKANNPLLEKLLAESMNLSDQQLSALVSTAQAMNCSN